MWSRQSGPGHYDIDLRISVSDQTEDTWCLEISRLKSDFPTLPADPETHGKSGYTELGSIQFSVSA